MMEAEKKEVAKQETARTGKPLTSTTATGGTSRQQALAAKKSKAQEKRDGKQVAIVEREVVGSRKSSPPKRSKEPKDKGIALPQVEDSEDITKEDQAPLKKAKMSKGKENGVLWPPTRFADIKIMAELEIDEDIKSMLEHMSMQSFFSMAHPTYEEVHEKVHCMTFKEIGQAPGLKDLEESSIPILNDAPKEESIARLVCKVLAGKDRKPSRDKNASIRHPSVRYLHRLIVHTIFPRKEPGIVNDEELQLLHQTIQHYAPPSQLSLVSTDFYKNFGMIGIGGLITPLLAYKDIPLGDDATGPTFLDGSYLKKAQYFSGRFDGVCVYSYLQSTKKVLVLLPNWNLTSLHQPGTISFDIGKQHFLAPHGPLGPMSSPEKKKTADKCGMYQEDTSGLNSELLYGPPRYRFEQCPGALASGPLRQAHEHIGNLQS
ncbi:hypothetical protein DY000_02039056 [Brassica cretica]|uniref:Arabidopsis retrotransposon Orf1 C-terminal domain-containing protein n=1 Tax=Brassica cretica TaxID=69181 RepID=A0ABQ7BLX4_BRACR|nr:hypothetical protein DY000_02039056 [Brassica cretica]